MHKKSFNWPLLGWSSAIILLGCLIITSIDDWGLKESWEIFISQIISILVITTALNFLWEQHSKDVFKKEILGTKTFSDQIERAGLIQIPSDQGFHDDIDWEKLFYEVRQLDLFVSYAYSWRQNNRNRLKSFAKREHSTANIILPNYQNDKIVSQLSLWYGKNEDKIKELIKNSARDFNKLFSEYDTDHEIYLTNTTPVYSFYRFDHIGILALYKHREEKSGVPSFIFKQGGSLYDFITQDFNFLKEDSNSYNEGD